VAVAGVTLLAVGGGATGLLRSRSRVADTARGTALAQQAYAALRTGATRQAVKLSTEARQLAPDDRQVAQAWLHSVGLDLLEGDQGDDPARRAVGFIDETRRLGAKGLDIAFALLVSAVTIKNDRLARRLLEQHEEQAIETDAFYELAAGAALDLDCDAVAEERFRRSGERWVDAALPKLRRARSLAFAGRYAEASEELEKTPGGPPAKLLGNVIKALETPRATHAYVDPFAITDLPRSLRPLAQALTVSAGNDQAGLDAALSDIDCPLVAIACSDIAAGASDFASAERALEVALEMRSELALASERLVRLRIRRGNLERAGEAARASGDTASLALVVAINAYEDGRAELLKQSIEDAGASHGWSLASTAQRMLGDGPKPTVEELSPLVAQGEPWADVLLFDVLLADGKIEEARKLVTTWSDASPARDKRRTRLSEREKQRP